MMLMVMVFAGALAGGGLALMARGALGSTPPLATIVAELHRPREGVDIVLVEPLAAPKAPHELCGHAIATLRLAPEFRSIKRGQSVRHAFN